jgi:hypothetical protein
VRGDDRQEVPAEVIASAEVFPVDCQKAFEMGARLASR